jgi:hypothetical protein
MRTSHPGKTVILLTLFTKTFIFKKNKQQKLSSELDVKLTTTATTDNVTLIFKKSITYDSYSGVTRGGNGAATQGGRVQEAKKK